MPKIAGYTPWVPFSVQPGVELYSEPLSIRTNDYHKTEEGTIGKFWWDEKNIDQYTSCPPKEILEKLKIHKERNVFDYFTIATVKHISDPLLLGRISNVQDRFFIAQWGEDIQLDDII